MRERILAALGRLIVRDGLANAGVNALAREARCDKVLIYRYFGNLDGVYEAFAARSDFWWELGELVAGIDPARLSLGETLKLILRRHAHAVRARRITLAVLAAELSERTALVVTLEDVRERRSLALLRWISENYPAPTRVDIAAVGVLLGVAINYLAVRAREIRVMNGVAIKTDKDWERILSAIDNLIDGLIRNE